MKGGLQLLMNDPSLLLTPCIGARGKAVHLLSAALTSKKRKRPERQERNMNLPFQLGSA